MQNDHHLGWPSSRSSSTSGEGLHGCLHEGDKHSVRLCCVAPAREVNGSPCRGRDRYTANDKRYFMIGGKKIQFIHSAELPTAEHYVFTFEQFLCWTKKRSNELLVRSAFNIR